MSGTTASRRPRFHSRLASAFAVATILGTAGSVDAATWVEVRTPNFTVVTDGSERRARDVAWQFEQVRAAVLAAWPWARPRLDLPVFIVAANGENTMRQLVPQLFDGRDRDSVTVSVLCTTPDRYAIVLRGDVRSEDAAGTINPYYASYWTYSYLSFNAAFEGQLPPWLVNGMAELLSNSLVTSSHIDFGRPTPWTLGRLRNEGRLRLAELIEITSASPYYRDSITRSNFDAQAWGVVHYLLFGDEKGGGRINDIAQRLLRGQTSAQAITEVFGSVEALERAYLLHHSRPLTQIGRARIDARISRDFPVRTMRPAEVAMIHAGIHAVYDRAADAETLVREARKAEPAAPDTYVTEGHLLDRAGNADAAAAAYARAIELGSENFYAFYRVAADLMRRGDPSVVPAAESHAARAAALNPYHGPSHALLGGILARGPDPGKGLAPAQRGVALEPNDPSARLALAAVLMRMNRRDEARGQALAARTLARTEEIRAEAQRLVEALMPPPPGAADRVQAVEQ